MYQSQLSISPSSHEELNRENSNTPSRTYRLIIDDQQEQQQPTDGRFIVPSNKYIYFIQKHNIKLLLFFFVLLVYKFHQLLIHHLIHHLVIHIHLLVHLILKQVMIHLLMIQLDQSKIKNLKLIYLMFIHYLIMKLNKI